MSFTNLLDRVKVAAPCPADWDRMFGGEPFGLLAARRREVVRRWRGSRRQNIDDGLQLTTFANRLAIKALLGRATARERRQAAALLRARRSRSNG